MKFKCTNPDCFLIYNDSFITVEDLNRYKDEGIPHIHMCHCGTESVMVENILEEPKPKETGGSAYPHGKVVREFLTDEGSAGLEQVDESRGMTLRDYFAGQALVGIVSTETEASHYIDSNGKLSQDYMAEQAYRIADAMIKERNRD